MLLQDCQKFYHTRKSDQYHLGHQRLLSLQLEYQHKLEVMRYGVQVPEFQL